jgi:hypothetical protein
MMSSILAKWLGEHGGKRGIPERTLRLPEQIELLTDKRAVRVPFIGFPTVADRVAVLGARALLLK